MKRFLSFGLLIAGLLLPMTPPAAAAALSIADVPLFLSNRVDPNVLFDMSIESPMVGAAYNDQDDTGSGGSCTGRACE